MFNILQKLKNGSRAGLIVYATLLIIFIYMLVRFFYLEIVGVYGVAVIQEAASTSEGIDFKYTFIYQGETYSGGFSGLGDYQIGGKYFVLFSKKNPSNNLLQYNTPVPECLKNSIDSIWEQIPTCAHN